MMRLLRAILVSYFGAGSTRPARAALWRLCSMCTLAIFGATYGVSLAKDLPLHASDHAAVTALVIAASMQVVTIAALLGARGITDKYAVVNGLLIFLPLSRILAWSLSLLPQLILTILVLALIGAPLFVAANLMGLTYIQAILVVCFGGVSGFSFMQLAYWARKTGKSFVIFGSLAIELLVLRQIFLGNFTGIAANVCQVLIMLAMAASITGLSLTYRAFAHTHRAPTALRTVRPLGAMRGWLALKSLRNKGMRLSLYSALAISSISAWGISRSNLQDPAMIATVAALLVSVCMSDIRMMSRRYNPPEISALRGTPRYLLDVAQPILLCMAACAPLIFLLLVQQLSLVYTLLYLTYFACGICAGFAMGCILAPQNKDISAQFFAVFSCAFLLWLPFQLPILSMAAPWQQCLTFTLLNTCLVLIGAATEYKRNPYTWRKNV